MTSDRMDHAGPAALIDQDPALLSNVASSLADGRRIKKWWEQTDATDSYAEKFELMREFNRPDSSFGFFDQVPLGGGSLPVMGLVQDMSYDQPKSPAIKAWRDGIREFVLTYFMRVSDFRPPEAYVEPGRRSLSPYFSALSWCPEKEARREGFGYSQLYYKLRDTNQVGEFPTEERFAIVDLREIGQKYEWIVVKIRLFDLNLTFKPLGAEFPYFVLPLREETPVILSRDFILNEDEPHEEGVLGKYGFGYALLKAPADRDVLAYGPGKFDAGFQLINFRVLEDGATRVRMVFVVNRPKQILNLPLDPVNWSFTLADLMSLGLTSRVFAPMKNVLDQWPLRIGGFDPLTTFVLMANLLSGGLAAEQLCISKERLEREMLVQHFMQHYDMIVGSLLTWRQIPNWLNKAGLPEWVITGISS